MPERRCGTCMHGHSWIRVVVHLPRLGQCGCPPNAAGYPQTPSIVRDDDGTTCPCYRANEETKTDE